MTSLILNQLDEWGKRFGEKIRGEWITWLWQESDSIFWEIEAETWRRIWRSLNQRSISRASGPTILYFNFCWVAVWLSLTKDVFPVSPQSESITVAIHPRILQSSCNIIKKLVSAYFPLPKTSSVQTNWCIRSCLLTGSKFHPRNRHHLSGHLLHLLRPRRPICCSQIHFYTCITIDHPWSRGCASHCSLGAEIWTSSERHKTRWSTISCGSIDIVIRLCW